MSTQIQGSNPHFHPFFEDNAVLIQFIIEEFIRSHQLISKINTLPLNLDELNSTPCSSLTSLISLLDNLAGSIHPHDRQSLAQWSNGALTQLKNHSEQFTRNTTSQNKYLLKFHRSVHQGWLSALYILELLNLLRGNPYTAASPSPFTLLSIKRSLHTLQKHFLRITDTLPKILSPYLDNENLVFTLLRNKDYLKLVYGNNFFANHFKKAPCQKNLKEWLISRYEARGFEAILPSIRLLLEGESCR